MKSLIDHKVDTNAIRRANPVQHIVEMDLGQARKRVGRRPYWLCPFHIEDTPSFTVYDDSERYYCFGCGANGDVINYVVKRYNLTFLEACQRLSVTAPVSSHKSTHKEDMPTTVSAKPFQSTKFLRLIPDAKWQESAMQIVVECEPILWDEAKHTGKGARRYLHERGLEAEILQKYLIGFNPQDQVLHGLFVPKGIIIPTYLNIFDGDRVIANDLYALNVRRPTGSDPKYKKVSGSKAAPFGLDSIQRKKVAFVLEGEFDTLLVLQALDTINKVSGGALDDVGAFTMGSATNVDMGSWAPYLLGIQHYLVAVDEDQAGEKAAEYWARLSSRVIRYSPAPYKDVTDLWKATGDSGLMQWMQDGLRFTLQR